VKLLFVHGWGFDSSLWDALTSHFPDCGFWERGYFGEAAEPALAEPFLAVTHSFGAMRFLGATQPGCRGIVAINGFDRFTSTEDFPGVASRIVERMIARLRSAPRFVVAEFRQRCGSDAPFGAIDEDLLFADLIALRDTDCREAAASCGLPILSLQGASDPILPCAMRAAVFASSARCERLLHPTGGHLLPLDEPGYCAEVICAFMERLT
jgi:pimeloyl-[acyl-carrier protein] methyl ester esterase